MTASTKRDEITMTAIQAGEPTLRVVVLLLVRLVVIVLLEEKLLLLLDFLENFPLLLLHVKCTRPVKFVENRTSLEDFTNSWLKVLIPTQKLTLLENSCYFY